MEIFKRLPIGALVFNLVLVMLVMPSPSLLYPQSPNRYHDATRPNGRSVFSDRRTLEGFGITLPSIGRIYGTVLEGTDAKETVDTIARQNGLKLDWTFNEKYGKYELVSIKGGNGRIIAQKDGNLGFHFSVGDGVIPIFMGADGSIRKFADFDEIYAGGQVRQIIIELVSTVFDPKNVSEMAGADQRGLLEKLQEAHGGFGLNAIVLPDTGIDQDGGLAYLSFVNVKTGETQVVGLGTKEESAVFDFIQQNRIPHSIRLVYELQERIFDCPSASDIIYAEAQLRGVQEKAESTNKNELACEAFFAENPCITGPQNLRESRVCNEPELAVTTSAMQESGMEMHSFAMHKESAIISLLMNPAERRLWGRMYGLPDGEEACTFRKTDAGSYTQPTRMQYMPANGKGNPQILRAGKGISNNSEKTENDAPLKLAFSGVSENPELKPEGTADENDSETKSNKDKDDGKTDEGEEKEGTETGEDTPDKSRFRLVIGELPKKRKKKQVAAQGEFSRKLQMIKKRFKDEPTRATQPRIQCKQAKPALKTVINAPAKWVAAVPKAKAGIKARRGTAQPENRPGMRKPANGKATVFAASPFAPSEKIRRQPKKQPSVQQPRVTPAKKKSKALNQMQKLLWLLDKKQASKRR